MCELLFREFAPKRTYSGEELTDYRNYKDFLEKDFNQRCGYTDCHQYWFGGKINFQIDHFRPISKYPSLKTEYSNLVYSCSYVNRAKSNDDGNYLDPCNSDYNKHFYRDTLGNIYPKSESESAKYMYSKLKLYLKRYGVIWMLERLYDKKELLKEYIQTTDNSEAKEIYLKLDFLFMEYLKYLRVEQ